MGRQYLVRYTLQNIFRIGPVRFKPGVNAITEEQWEAIKDHPLLPMRFETKDDLGHPDLIWVEGKGPDDFASVAEGDEKSDDGAEASQESDEYPLADMNVKEATKVVKATFDLDLLGEWSALEDRKTIMDAISAQINLIESHGEDD